MNVRVQLFALARQLAGRDEVLVDLPEEASVAAVRAGLARAVPALAPLLPHLRIAVDSQYVADDAAVPAGAEVACIPPVSGG